MAVSIYCNMKKIIYFYTVREKEKGGRLRQCLRNLIGEPYPITCRKGIFLQYPMTAYCIGGLDAASLASYEKSNSDGKCRAEKKRDRRLSNTLRKLNQKLQKEERLQSGRSFRRTDRSNMTFMSENTFLLYEWRDCICPSELLLRFYEDCRRNSAFIRKAEQLIFLDGGNGESEGRFAELQNDTEPEMTLVSEIYAVYNYITIVTERKEIWQEFTELAYEEYGLSVRCVCDSAGLTFREKKTLIIDLRKQLAKCHRSFPKESIYMDLRENVDKEHRISVKCAQIPHLSLYNALDTVLKDTV